MTEERICTRCRRRPWRTRKLCHACYMTVREREKAYGRWESGHVDSAPAREHVERLIARGVGIRRISELSGVNRKAVQQLLHGRSDRGTAPTKKLMRSTAERLLAVPVPSAAVWCTAAPGAPVDGTGTRRRLQALIADGHTQLELASEIGWTQQNLSPLVHGNGQVLAETARKVAVVFDRLQLIPGSNQWARDRGARFGWPLPMEWDDIDDPDAMPVRSRRKGAGQRDAAIERREAIAAWLDDRRPEFEKGTTAQIADRLGTTMRTVERDKARIRAEREESVA